MSQELLPCPFCGTNNLHDRFVGDEDGGFYEVLCTQCNGADRFAGVHAENREVAVASWNTSATPAAEGREVLDSEVEAGAQGMVAHVAAIEPDTTVKWADATEDMRDEARTYARACLEAALRSPVDARCWVQITDGAIQAACEAYSEVYVDQDKDMGDAMRAALQAALALSSAQSPSEVGK